MGECRREQSPDSRRRPENDEHWASADPEWVGKASMGQRHRFMLVRDLSWSLFNVLAFGLQSTTALQAAVEMLETMEAAARLYVSKTAGWSSNVGMYFHVYGHASVNALHLHLVDLDATGPTYEALSYKNLPLQAVLGALRNELDLAEAVRRLPRPNPTPREHTPTLGTKPREL